MSSSFGPGGMPRARHQMFDDMLIPEDAVIPSKPSKYTPNYGSNYNQPGPGSPPPMPYNQGNQGLQYPQQQNFRSSAGSLNSIPTRPTSSNASYGPNKSSGGSLTQGGISGNSSKSSLFSGWKKKQPAQPDFDEDEGENVAEYGPNVTYSNDTGPDISMNQLAGLRDRDRYPSLANDPSSAASNTSGRTMSLRSMSNFDTTPIIPTFSTTNEGKHANQQYRKNLSNSHKQLLRTSGGAYPPPQAGYGNMRPPGGRNSPSFMYNNGPQQPSFNASNGGPIPMAPQDTRMRSMTLLGPSPNFNPHGPNAPTGPNGFSGPNSYNGPDRFNGPNGSNMPPSGRAMSMGGYPRGPPLMNSGPSGPQRPPIRQSLPTPMLTQAPHPMRTSLPPVPVGNSASQNYPPRSRSSSKSSPPSSAVNSMSRPNSSQTFSAASSPENAPKPISTAFSMPEPSIVKQRSPSPSSVYEEDDPLSNKNPKITPSVSPMFISDARKEVAGPAVLERSTTSISSHSPAIPAQNVVPSQKDMVIDTATTPTQVSTSNTTRISPDTVKLIEDLKSRNISLLNEVRMVTSELTDSIRRELGLSESQEIETPSQDGKNLEQLTMNHRERALLVLSLQTNYDMERRQRLVAEDQLCAISNDVSLKPLYAAAHLESRLASTEHKLLNSNFKNEMLQKELDEVKESHHALEEETEKLKNSTLPELKSHVEDLELLTTTGNPVELLKQIDELKVENKKLTSAMEQKSNTGPTGEKMKAIESQRDALREALRSLRERKDHEIRQSSERIRQLEAKLEKERVINAQMQRKVVQVLRTASNTNSPTTPSHDSYDTSTGRNMNGVSGPLSSPHADSFNLVLPKRKVYHNSQLSNSNNDAHPGSVSSVTSNSTRSISPAHLQSRATSPSPVLFDISSDPSWTGPQHEMPSTKFTHNPSSSVGSMYSYKGTLSHAISSSSLSLPNGRNEQIPLSLGSGH